MTSRLCVRETRLMCDAAVKCAHSQINTFLPKNKKKTVRDSPGTHFSQWCVPVSPSVWCDVCTNTNKQKLVCVCVCGAGVCSANSSGTTIPPVCVCVRARSGVGVCGVCAFSLCAFLTLMTYV